MRAFLNIGLCVACLMECSSAFAEVGLTGDTGADCTNCGIWPWSSTCRWAETGTPIQYGLYREGRGDKGATPCHPVETSLPFCSTVTMESSEEYSFVLQSGEWSWFGFTFLAGYSQNLTTSVSVNNCCTTSGCCLVPMKGFMRWSYRQVVIKQRIAKAWSTYGSTSQYYYFNFDDCVACNSNTRKLGVLLSWPSPDLKFATDVFPQPYDAALKTMATYCGN